MVTYKNFEQFLLRACNSELATHRSHKGYPEGAVKMNRIFDNLSTLGITRQGP